MRRTLTALAVLFCLAVPCLACLWDEDTLDTEVSGMPDTIEVIAGRFPRNPDLYYQMRLARVTQELKTTPDKLELYDDAAVACDHLHRDPEAIEWMARKATVIARLRSSDKNSSDLDTHQYRYLANLGTFHAHNWLRSGADRKNIQEMRQARDLIAHAIKLNPDAHFGREKYQLQAMNWILHPPKWNSRGYESLPSFIVENATDNPSKAVKGLAGIIVLGDAWQSVDIFNALAHAIQLDGDRTSMAYLAQLRVLELIKSGKKSLIPDPPKDQKLEELLFADDETGQQRVKYESRPEIESTFKELRADADIWQQARTDYMMPLLKAGKHPDTDEDFWKNWHEPTRPTLYTQAEQGKTPSVPWPYLILAASALVGTYGLRHRKRRIAVRKHQSN